MPRSWITSPPRSPWNRNSVLSTGNGATYRGTTGRRPYIAVIVLGPIERVVEPLRPYALLIVAKCPVSAPVVEGAI